MLVWQTPPSSTQAVSLHMCIDIRSAFSWLSGVPQNNSLLVFSVACLRLSLFMQSGKT